MSLSSSPLTYINLDPPFRLAAGQETFVFIGWAEVDDEDAPDIRLALNGIEFPVVAQRNPLIQVRHPGLKACAFYAKVNFRELFAGLDPVPEPFLLEAAVISDHRSRLFEYEVTADWLDAVFGRPIRPRRIPPEHLQIRVAGAAAGQFHVTGRLVAEQIADLVRAGGRRLADFRSILDFGAGPGRVVDCIADIHPSARLAASDIDGEAIAWAQAALGDIAEFKVNGERPPLPWPDESFDLIYSISTFTHFPEDLQWAWLGELRRVLKPGGVLLTTKLNAAAYELPDKVQAEFADRGFVYWGEADLTPGLPSFYRLAYHSDAYVRAQWGRYFDVLHVGAHDLNNTQDSVLLRRPRHALSWLPSPVRKGLYAAARAVGAVR